MKKIFPFILIGLILFLSISLGVYLLNQKNVVDNDLIPSNNNSATFPQGHDEFETENVVKIKVPNKNSTEVQMNNFIKASTTVIDPMNEEHYLLYGDLGYCLQEKCFKTGGDDMLIMYTSKDNYFSVTILSENYDETLMKAEQFLLTKLGVTKTELCALKHTVDVPYWINEDLSNKKLDFTFCN